LKKSQKNAGLAQENGFGSASISAQFAMAGKAQQRCAPADKL